MGYSPNKEYLYCQILYADITSDQETNSVYGDKDKMPRSVRFDDVIEVKFEKSKSQYYNNITKYNSSAIGHDPKFAKAYDMSSFKSSDLTINSDIGLEISYLEIVSGGTGYSAGTLTATGGNGEGFKGSYTVSSGVIDSVEIINRGKNYTSEPTIVISDAGNSDATIKGHITPSLFNWFEPEENIWDKELPCYTIDVKSGLDATKIADGTVTDTEFQYISSLTSNAQTQINDRLRDLLDDSTPQLGGNLDVNGKNITSTADITLDADGGDIFFKDGGTTLGSIDMDSVSGTFQLLSNLGKALRVTGATDLELNSNTGDFKWLNNGTEFSSTDSAYAGCILSYTHLDSTTGTTSYTLTTAYAVPSNKWRTVFTVPPSGSVEISASFYRDSSTSNERVYASLSTSFTYSTYDLGQMYDYGVGYADETDDSYMTVKWVITGLTAGSSETLYIGLRASTGTTYVKYGGTNSNGRKFPPVVIKTTALPETILT